MTSRRYDRMSPEAVEELGEQLRDEHEECPRFYSDERYGDEKEGPA